MGNRKRLLSSTDDQEVKVENHSNDAKVRHSKEGTHADVAMEKMKKRRALDKERHRKESLEKDPPPKIQSIGEFPVSSVASNGLVGIHIDVFNGLASADSSVREAAAEKMVKQLLDIQRVYEELGRRSEHGDGDAYLEAEKNDDLGDCSPSLRYAIRRLIRGVSSPREYARPGFALGLTLILEKIPTIKVEAILKLIVELLEVSCAMKGQEAKECLFGRLFAYGALAASGRISAQQISNNDDSIVKDFTGHVISLSQKKRYLSEPAVSIILDLIGKLPDPLLSHLLEVPGIRDWFKKAIDVGNSDALFLALKLQERVPLNEDVVGDLLPHPWNSNHFFARDHLSYLTCCFTETSFCLPRVHSLWPFLIDLLIPDTTTLNEEVSSHSSSSKKHKKSRKGSSFEDIKKNIQNFCEVVIELSMLLSSHERKLLAFEILILILPKLPASCVQIVVSPKLVFCLMDILSTQGTWLQKAAQHFLKELIKWAEDKDDRRIGLIASLQKHSGGKFDCITRTWTVRDLVSKFRSGPGCLQFVHNLMSLFLDEGTATDEPSDQSQTTDENSESGSPEDDTLGMQGNDVDFLKNWVIEMMPRVLRNINLNSDANSLAHSEQVKLVDDKFRVQVEVLKFLAIQGLFSASLGTEVTSFELQEKFKWPKAASSSSVRKVCIKHLMLLLESAQKMEGSVVMHKGLECNDLGLYFIGFLNTLCNIPSVSFYRTLSSEDEKAFKKLQVLVSKLGHEEGSTGLGPDFIKLHEVRYLLIQLMLQVLLHPDEFSESANEIVICCRKAFHPSADSDSDHEFNDNEKPELMDVLVDTFLSLLPQASSSMVYSIEQVFRLCCGDITDAGLLQMLRIVRKDLKPGRNRVDSSDDEDEDDDFLGFEEADGGDELDDVDIGGEVGDKIDDLEETDDEVDYDGVFPAEKTDDEKDSDKKISAKRNTEEVNTDGKEDHSASEDSNSDMNDDAMFRMDSYLSRIFKERKLATSDSALSQLVPFKLRVLSLLEIYLHKNPGKSNVLMIYSHLARAFVNYQSAEHSQQLAQRILGILQKKIFKAKEYPKGSDIELPTLLAFLQKSLRLASRSRHKAVSSLAQASTFWLLKIIHAKNLSGSELDGVVLAFRESLADYFDNKASRLKSGFLKEIIQRQPWLGSELFGFLLEKCRGVKSEFRRVDSLEMLDAVMRLRALGGGVDGKAKDVAEELMFLKGHLPALCELIGGLLSQPPGKRSRRGDVRRFCTRVLQAITTLKLKKAFLKALTPESIAACESQLGDSFLPFKTKQMEN